MSQTTSSWDQRRTAALEYVWGEYRTWAATARQQRTELSSWRFRVLLLAIMGAFLGTLSQYLNSAVAEASSWLAPAGIIGILSAVAIGLATFFTREILSPERERRWIRARSAAEALKSETYLFRAAVPPYDAVDAAVQLTNKAEELVEHVRDVAAVSLTPAQRHERLPQGPLTVPSYITERVDDQINNFYLKRVQEYDGKVRRTRNIILVLGILATVLGLIGASGWTAGWIAVITTIIAALTTYVSAERYQYLLVSYQATARQLDALRTRWAALGSPESDAIKRNEFISGCEEAISIENQGWMAKWSEVTPSLIPAHNNGDVRDSGSGTR